jgi:HlyD family secretion protein
MSVSADIETLYRTNVLTVPLASVTSRAATPTTDPPPKSGTNSVASAAKSTTGATNSASGMTNSIAGVGGGDAGKLTDVVFVVQGDHVKVAAVTIGICDDNYWEITSGLTNGQEIVSGGYKAISRDLQDGSKVKKGLATADAQK